MNRESSSLLRRRLLASFPAVFAVAIFLVIIAVFRDHSTVELNQVQKTPSLTHRKLLNQAPKGKTTQKAAREAQRDSAVEPNRIWSEKCSKSDIVISQGATAPLPNGIPTYTVEIMNVCPSGRDISAVHLSCGWFSSARLVNPRVFKRLRFDDCLVNDGKPLVNGRTLSFQYANTFPFHLAVSSVTC